jgi:hypothetical protein
VVNAIILLSVLPMAVELVLEWRRGAERPAATPAVAGEHEAA